MTAAILYRVVKIAQTLISKRSRFLTAALGAPDSWNSWMAILKAASGQLLDSEERAVFDSDYLRARATPRCC
jgi:hypothetical protein